MEVDPIDLMIAGIILSLVGISLLWKHPNKWKAIGTTCAVAGLIINVVNLFLHVNSLQIPSMS